MLSTDYDLEALGRFIPPPLERIRALVMEDEKAKESFFKQCRNVTMFCKNTLVRLELINCCISNRIHLYEAIRSHQHNMYCQCNVRAHKITEDYNTLLSESKFIYRLVNSAKEALCFFEDNHDKLEAHTSHFAEVDQEILAHYQNFQAWNRSFVVEKMKNSALSLELWCKLGNRSYYYHRWTGTDPTHIR